MSERERGCFFDLYCHGLSSIKAESRKRGRLGMSEPLEIGPKWHLASLAGEAFSSKGFTFLQDHQSLHPFREAVSCLRSQRKTRATLGPESQPLYSCGSRITVTYFSGAY